MFLFFDEEKHYSKTIFHLGGNVRPFFYIKLIFYFSEILFDRYWQKLPVINTGKTVGGKYFPFFRFFNNNNYV